MSQKVNKNKYLKRSHNRDRNQNKANNLNRDKMFNRYKNNKKNHNKNKNKDSATTSIFTTNKSKMMTNSSNPLKAQEWKNNNQINTT